MNFNNSSFTFTTDSVANKNFTCDQYDYFNIDNPKSLNQMTCISKSLNDHGNSLDNFQVDTIFKK